MQGPQSDVFALKNSGLDAFLYADVGAEANGSTLTILSILARLGKDPWAEAARWAALPKPAAIDNLAQSIAEMPLEPSALAGARDSAVRLVQLLPTNTPTVQRGNAPVLASAMPKGTSTTILYSAFAVWMALNMFLAFKPASDVPARTEYSATMAGATDVVPRLLSKETAVAGPSAAPDRK